MNKANVLATIVLAASISAAATAQDATAPAAINPRIMQRVEHRLNITQQQREQIKSILQQEAPALVQLRQGLVAERDEMTAASSAGFNPAAAQAVASKYASTHADAAVERAKLRAELTAVLTPEQQQKLRQLRGRFGAAIDAQKQAFGGTL